MGILELRSKFRQLEKAAKTIEDKPVLLHVSFMKDGCRCEIQSCCKVLFSHPHGWRGSIPRPGGLDSVQADFAVFGEYNSFFGGSLRDGFIA